MDVESNSAAPLYRDVTRAALFGLAVNLLLGIAKLVGGIAGYEVAETTDENLERAAMVMRMTAAFMRTQRGLDPGAWSREVEDLARTSAHVATVSEKS